MKLKKSKVRAPCDTVAVASKALPLDAKPLPPAGGNIVDDLLRSNEAMLRQQQQQPEWRQQEPDDVVRCATAPPSLAQEPPPRPAHAKHTATSHTYGVRGAASHTYHRKRVRCDAHKHCDPVDTGGSDGVVSAQGACRPSHSGGGAAAAAVATVAVAGGAGEAKAHVHGASCGHIAVLHENHVDFLIEGGQLECYDGKEVREGSWKI